MLLLKVVLTLIVAYVWLMLLIANVYAAGRTAGQMQHREGIPFAHAQHRTTILVLIWATVQTVVALLAGWLIWAKL